MNCWKTVNVSKDIGTQKLFFISLLTMFVFFIVIYLPISIINSGVILKADSVHFFIIGLFALVPLHQLFQTLPIWCRKRKIIMRFQLKYWIFPYVKVKQCHSISRRLSIISLVTPCFGITIPLLLASIRIPEYMHYFTILAALHAGISFRDYLYVYMFVRAPKKSQIENHNTGFDILI